jgi:hypothetical protein
MVQSPDRIKNLVELLHALAIRMSGMSKLRKWQFSLKSLLGALTVIFLTLPLIPIFAVLAVWYIVEPDGMILDLFRWYSRTVQRAIKSRRTD